MKTTRHLLLLLVMLLPAMAGAAESADSINQWVMKARQMLSEGSYYSALRESEKVFQASEERGDEYGLATAYGIIGETALAQRNNKRAAENFRQSLLILTTKFKTEKARISHNYFHYLIALLKMGDLQETKQVLDRWEKHLDEWKEEQQRDRQPTEPLTEDFTRLKLLKAEYLSSAGETDEALKIIKEVETTKGSRSKICQRLAAECYAKYYQATGNYTKALEAADRCRQMSIADNDSTALLDNMELQARLLMQMGRKRDAAPILKAANSLKDQLLREESGRMLKEMYEYYKIDERIAAENQRAEQTRSLMLNILAIALCVIAAILVFVVLSRRRMVNQLKKSTEQLATTNKELEEANRLALLSAKQKEQFIRHVSHEVRTPLNTISGFTQVLTMPGMETPEAERQRLVQQINGATKNIIGITHSLKELSDLESTETIERNTRVGCNAICETAATQSGVKDNPNFEFIYTDNTPEDTIIQTNDRALVQILRELLTNAQKFAGKGTITLNCAQPSADAIEFSVTDNGKTIPENEGEHIFESFFKLNEYDVGIGSGLTICRSLAERLGGKLWLDTNFKNGNRFILKLTI